jgi:uncharacterized protein YwgA
LVKPLDIALLITFFGSNDISIKGRTRVQKDICILQHADNIPFSFKFQPYYYGPYSTELTDTIGTLVAAGLLEQTITTLSSGIRRYDYSLSEAGKELYSKNKQILKAKSPDTFTKLVKRAKKLKRMPMTDVIALAKRCSGIESTI